MTLGILKGKAVRVLCKGRGANEELAHGPCVHIIPRNTEVPDWVFTAYYGPTCVGQTQETQRKPMDVDRYVVKRGFDKLKDPRDGSYFIFPDRVDRYKVDFV